MKTFRRSAGAFSEQPFFSLDEIEQTCRRELMDTGLYPSTPEPIRIDRFIEKRFGVVPDFGGDLPRGVLGLTVFGSKGVEQVVVSRALDEEGSRPAERRIRSTLAHEAGHGLFHAYLFVLEEHPSMLPREQGSPRILCRDVPDAVASKRYRGPPHEFQANRAIGGLLLPRPLVGLVAEPFIVRQGPFGRPELAGDRRDRLVREVAEVFNVNPIVASIRIDEMFAKEDAAQISF